MYAVQHGDRARHIKHTPNMRLSPILKVQNGG